MIQEAPVVVAEETISYQSPSPQPGQFHFADHFDDVNQFAVKWIRSQAKKGDSEEKYDGVWSQEAPERPILADDLGLVLKSKAKHAAIATRLTKPFVFADKPLVVQYEVQLQVCGMSILWGIYLFLSKN